MFSFSLQILCYVFPNIFPVLLRYYVVLIYPVVDYKYAILHSCVLNVIQLYCFFNMYSPEKFNILLESIIKNLNVCMIVYCLI